MHNGLAGLSDLDMLYIEKALMSNDHDIETVLYKLWMISIEEYGYIYVIISNLQGLV